MLRKEFFTIFVLLASFTSVYAEEFDEGIEFIQLNSPVKTVNPDKVVVTEMFWYGCPHCFQLESYMQKWKQSIPEGVEFQEVPSVLNPSWMEHARAFFALDMMGVRAKVHSKLFNAIHVQNKRLNSLDTLSTFVAGLGVDEQQFREHYHSFPVDTKVRKSRNKERKYGHRGVPAIIINGKYRTSASMAGGNARMVQVVDYLVEKELKQQADQYSKTE